MKRADSTPPTNPRRPVEVAPDVNVSPSFYHGLREADSNRWPSGHDPDELPLLHPALERLTQANVIGLIQFV